MTAQKKTRPDAPGRVFSRWSDGYYSVPLSPLLRREDDDSSVDDEPFMPSFERPDEPLIPSLDWRLEPRDDEESLLEALRLEPLDPDEAPRPSPWPERDDPFADAFRLPDPDRSCELPRPELVLPEAPRPSLRVLLSPTVLLRSLDSLDVRSVDWPELRSLDWFELPVDAEVPLPDAP